MSLPENSSPQDSDATQEIKTNAPDKSTSTIGTSTVDSEVTTGSKPTTSNDVKRADANQKSSNDIDDNLIKSDTGNRVDNQKASAKSTDSDDVENLTTSLNTKETNSHDEHSDDGLFNLNSGVLAGIIEKVQNLRSIRSRQIKDSANSTDTINSDSGNSASGHEASPNSTDNSADETAKVSIQSSQSSYGLPSQKLRLVFLGGGSFGTAMSNLAARNGCDSTLWVRNKRTVRSLQKHRVNKKYLPRFALDNHLKFEHDLKTAVQDKDVIFVAVPSSAFRETLQKIAPYISGQSVVSLTKGMEKDTFALMSDIIKEELPEVNFGVMSGPNLAVEIMRNMPSASVIASDSEPLRRAVQTALHSAFFRIFASDDVRGVELGGALKNIYAIAMGMAAAHNVGENTKAMLLTRALAEMSRFGAASGANPLTFLGLAGVGDLYATCSSELSRNYQIGNMLGKGLSLESAIKKLGQTAEGVNTIQQVHDKANKLGIYMPITHALHAIIYEDHAALGVALNLMETGFRSDVEFVMPHDQGNDALTAQIKEQASD